MTVATPGTNDLDNQNLPEGLFFHETLGLWAKGLVARDLVNHLTLPRPTKPLESCTFDGLGGNTTLSMHLAQISPGGIKCNHRHLDETTAFIVAGSGWSEFKQDDEKEPIRIDWKAGDLVVIPTNSWHKHTNASATEPARQLSFRNTTYITKVLLGGPALYHSKEGVYHQDARFYDRFADEPDYFTSRVQTGPDEVQMNYVHDVTTQPVPAANPALGTDVAMQHFAMGGQRNLDLAVVAIGAGGAVRPYRSLAEEGMYILQGSGRTTMWSQNGPSKTIDWKAGDLVVAPINTWREHSASGTDDVRTLLVRNIAFETSLGIDNHSGLDTQIPDRLTELV